jgi:GIY-YIG catalytic domain
MKTLLTVISNSLVAVAYGICLTKINEPGIYVIVGNRGTLYIGSSLPPIKQRYAKHTSDLRRNIHHNPLLQNAYNDGEAFLVVPIQLLARDTPDALVDQQEQSWIDMFGDRAVNMPNSTHRGERGREQKLCLLFVRE